MLGSGSDGLLKQAVVDGQPLVFVAINYRLGCEYPFIPPPPRGGGGGCKTSITTMLNRHCLTRLT